MQIGKLANTFQHWQFSVTVIVILFLNIITERKHPMQIGKHISALKVFRYRACSFIFKHHHEAETSNANWRRHPMQIGPMQLAGGKEAPFKRDKKIFRFSFRK